MHVHFKRHIHHTDYILMIIVNQLNLSQAYRCDLQGRIQECGGRQFNETGSLGAALRSQVGPRRNIDGVVREAKPRKLLGFTDFIELEICLPCSHFYSFQSCL